MVAWLRHFTYLLPALFQLITVFIRAWFYWKTLALANLPLPAGRALQPKEYRRWRHYFFGTTFLAAVFCQLRGRRLSCLEQGRYAALAALASLFDDQVDRVRQLEKPQNPEALGARLNDGGLALHLLREIYSTVPTGNLPAFKEALNCVFQLEIIGSGGGSPAQLEQAALDKGGYSVLLFWYLLEQQKNNATRTTTDGVCEERAFVLQFGGFVQVCDDCFDVWFDRQNQTATLATIFLEKNKPEQLWKCFKRQLEQVAFTARQLPQAQFRCETALRVVCFLAGVARVCLRHYSQLKKKRGTLPLDDRRDMVLDMAQWRHRWRAFLEILKNKI